MNRISSRIALIGVGAVLVFAAAGCGGSDDDSGDALTKEDYIAQANEICSGVSDDLDALESDFNDAYEAEDYEAAAEVLSEGNDMVIASVDEIKDLTPPEEDQETIDGWLELVDQQNEASEGIIDAVAENDDAAVNEVGKEVDEIETEADQIADDYGITDCGSNN